MWPKRLLRCTAAWPSQTLSFRDQLLHSLFDSVPSLWREPAKVYAEAGSGWVVEAPPERQASVEARKVFSGPNGLLLALVYAHQVFGSARSFFG